jgi:hypothetical protein
MPAKYPQKSEETMNADDFVFIPRGNCLIFQDMVLVPRSSIRNFFSVMEMPIAKEIRLHEQIQTIARMIKAMES